MKKYQGQQRQILCLPKRNKGVLSQKFKKNLLNSNFYKVDVSSLSNLCIFAIKFMPDEVKEKKEAIIKSIMPDIKQFIKDPIIKGDYIYSKKIPKQKDKTIVYGDYVIMIREIQRFNASKNPQKLLYFLGNVMRKVMDKMGYIQVSNTRKFINMNKSIQHQDLFIFEGFKLHFQLLENGYFLNIDTTKKIIRNQSVLQYIDEIYHKNRHIDRDEKRQIIKENIINKIIMTNYGKPRYFQIQDILFIDLTQIIVQTYSSGLLQYYKLRYQIEIKNIKQPLLLANTKKNKIKTYLIPQLCLMTGIPQNFDQFNHKIVSQIGKYQCHDRKVIIDEFVNQMKNTKNDNILPNLGIQILGQSQKIQAKIIPMPSIHFGQGRKLAAGRESYFPMYENPILQTKSKTKLGILTFNGINPQQVIQSFHSFFKSLQAYIEISTIKSQNHNSKKSIDMIGKMIQKIKNDGCNICMIIITNDMRHLYRKIKQTCLIQKNIICQIVLQKTLKSKKIQNTALKIYLQILAKSGHILWSSIPKNKKQKIMLVSFYASPIWKQGIKTFKIGICATCNDSHTQIFSKVKKYQKQFDEMQNMKTLLLQALNIYQKINKFIPQEIIILQNAKTTKNQKQSLEFFIHPFNSTINDLYQTKKPKITYIIIKKTLHHRFFQQSQGKYTNPPIGTLINTHLTSTNQDFYMISHNSIKSKNSLIPLNYKIVFSDSNLEQAIIYQLLFSQCFSYANYSGAIKQPALIQYVIKCVKFASDVLNGDVSQKLEMAPYYI